MLPTHAVRPLSRCDSSGTWPSLLQCAGTSLMAGLVVFQVRAVGRHLLTSTCGRGLSRASWCHAYAHSKLSAHKFFMKGAGTQGYGTIYRDQHADMRCVCA